MITWESVKLSAEFWSLSSVVVYTAWITLSLVALDLVIGGAEGGSGVLKNPPGWLKLRTKTQVSASCRVCLDNHVYVYGCVQSKSDQWNNVK